MSVSLKSRSSAAEPALPGVSGDMFRAGMARLGAAVNIVTTDGPAGRAGFTASAVCSVSDAPPILLLCLNRSASVHDAFSANRAVCVNTLRPGHEDLSRLFGGKTPMDVRFAAASWHKGASGAPILDDAGVSFDCRISSIASAGSHDVIFCDVLAVEVHQLTAALMYFDRRFHHL